ncbi:hypothetical protein NQ314_008542 [Rhamnusium bicolor]|uniref:Uncharacterized protein n=1 Tax=Rhamnusium bicolor TaxID=1586634 RepID=A0AAV8YAE5_9CUCU|nr:hypothetical protein NQ314_008542 [Rhamnusium bicolor]
MKLVILFAVVAVSLAAPQSGRTDVRYAVILRLDNDIFPDGSYRQQKVIGNNVGTAAQGSFQYTSPEGIPVHIQYIADENGFQPIGNVLPTPPPVPEVIARSIQFNAANQQPVNPYRRP